MKVIYDGPSDAVELPLPEGGWEIVERGEGVEVSSEHGASLLEQVDVWQPGDDEAAKVRGTIDASSASVPPPASATRSELEAYAKKIGVADPGSYQNKAELYAAIEAQQAANSEGATAPGEED